MAMPLPPLNLDLSSMASSSASAFQGPITFGAYTASPVIGSGNDPVAGGSIDRGFPGWVWPVALVGVYWLAKQGAK